MEQNAEVAGQQHTLALGALRRARAAFTAARVPMDRPEAWTASQRTAVADYSRAWVQLAITATAVAVSHDVDPWRH